MPPSPVVVDVPTSLAPRPSASFAGAESAPKLMPAIVTGIASSSGRFAKPLDRETIFGVVREHSAVLLAEDHALAGGFCSAVLEALAPEGIAAGHVRTAGLPDRLVSQASRQEQLAELELDGAEIASARARKVPYPHVGQLGERVGHRHRAVMQHVAPGQHFGAA